MNDDHIKSDIALYLSGELPESRNRQIEAHATACEKCRAALNKARAKQARVRREALKKASTEKSPNWFLARQGKESGMDRPSMKFPWKTVGVLLLAGGGYWVLRHSSPLSPSTSTPADLAGVAVSSAPASSPAALPASPTLALSSGTAAAAPPKPVSVVIPIVQEWKGIESGIKDTRSVVIRTKEEWAALWAEMQMLEPIPEINFAAHLVIGIFAGEQPAGTSVAFGKIRGLEQEIVAPYRFSASAVDVSTAIAPIPTHPYAVALIGQSEKKIRLTQKEAPR